MNFLERRIIEDGTVKPGNMLKVDSFLNHQMDMALVDEIAEELIRRFSGNMITRVLTIETSGIAIACAVARKLGVPMVYARKNKSVNLDGEVFHAQVLSFTQGKTEQIYVSKKYLGSDDHVLIVDDLMANGCVLQGLISIVEDAEAQVVGCGIAIEKGFQEGGDRIRNLGYRVESVAIIESMDSSSGAILFRRNS